MDADEPEDFEVAIRQVKVSDGRRSLETGMAGGGHPSSESEADTNEGGEGFAPGGETFLKLRLTLS